jgi:hypothetical protein
MFRVTDKNGQVIAQPAARSELDTYLNTSWPGWDKRTDNVRDDNNFDILDDKGDPLATVTGPKPPAGQTNKPENEPNE